MLRVTPSSLRFSVLVLIGLLVLSPACSLAGTSPEEVKKFNDYKAMAEKIGKGEFDNIERALGQIGLGYCYAKGEGVETDPAKAFFWWRKASEDGHANAQYLVGGCYASGEGVEKNLQTAFSWFRKSAEQGYPPALTDLGHLYANGSGVEKDQVEAVKYYQKAADKGFAEAQAFLGDCYYKGEGAPKDYVQAASWYLKAAKQGVALSQLMIGVCYVEGDGVGQDSVEAYAYWNLAGMTLDDARTNLATLEKRLSKAQIAAGQKRTRELQKEIEANKVGK
jgi:TPR repeat protein